MAGTNRIMTYAKGLSEIGCNVTIYCIKPTEKPGKIFNKDPSGHISPTIEFKYLSGTTVLSKNNFSKQVQYVKGVLKMCFEILLKKKKSKPVAIIYYAYNPIPAIFLFIITRLKRIQFYKEVSEYPLYHEINLSGVNKFLFRHVHYNLFDGLFVMTQRLIQFFREEKKIKAKYLHLPMTVDYNRFCINLPEQKIENYIGYCGILNNKKDGTDILLNSFAQISMEFPNIRLKLIGEINSEVERKEYYKIVKDHNLEQRVDFMGRVSSDLIPELLCNAKMLVLPRPESLQAEGGFPTKLGEYLSTGKPVIATKVGEIPFYLTHKKNAFLIEPGNLKSLTNELRYVLTHEEEVRRVGEQGKVIVMKYFNYTTQARKMVEFINSHSSNIKNRFR